MEISYSELRERDVINVTDGRSLGRVCDLVFTYPDGIVCGIVVPGRKRGFPWFRPCNNDIFIDLEQVQKIGKDVILVNLNYSHQPRPNKDCHRIKGRDDEEKPRRSRIDMNDYE
ncbi:MAG: YlmC/YmxH family sporulation protein [Bacillota bacterium]|nr:MAG: YlmC/YmxH family sporulation protein [Bacillota bacterium]